MLSDRVCYYRHFVTKYVHILHKKVIHRLIYLRETKLPLQGFQHELLSPHCKVLTQVANHHRGDVIK